MVFVETWPDTDFAERWTVESDEGPLGRSASGGLLTLTHSDQVLDIGGGFYTTPPANIRLVSPTTTPFLDGGFLSFYVDLPAPGAPGFLAEINLRSGYPGTGSLNIEFTLYTDGGSPLVITGNGADLDAEIDYSKPYYLVSRAGDQVTIASSATAEGTYTALHTFTWDSDVTGPSWVEISSVRYTQANFVGEELVVVPNPPSVITWGSIVYDPGELIATKTATARWDVGRYDLAGDFERSAGRFSPVAR